MLKSKVWLFNNISTSKVRCHEVTDYQNMLDEINSLKYRIIRMGTNIHCLAYFSFASLTSSIVIGFLIWPNRRAPVEVIK